MHKHLAASLFVNSLLTGLFLAADERFLHWFIIPTMICGSICLTFLFQSIAEGRPFLDPRILISLQAYCMTFLAPLLHIYWDYRILGLAIQPEDYRPWLGRLGCFNLLGFAVFLFVCSRVLKGRRKRRITSVWVINKNRLIWFSVALIGISVILQTYVYVAFGGFEGYVDKYLNDKQSWENMGWLTVIAEAAPLMAVMGLGGVRQGQRRRPSLTVLVMGALLFFCLQLIFGGLRGSRSNVAINCFFAAGIVHEVFRPLSKSFLALSAIALVAFSYFYTFFKDFGFDGVQAMFNAEARDTLSRRSGRSMDSMLLSDFNRADTQAFVLQQLDHGSVDFAFGRTYLGALSLMIPRAIWPERLSTKIRWTTQLENGADLYGTGAFRSSRMYGQVGEAILNFGYFGIPLAFAVLGLAVGYVTALFDQLPSIDARRLLVPGLIISCIYMVIQDSDNFLYFVVKYVSMPLFLVWISSRRRPVFEMQPGSVPAQVNDDRRAQAASAGWIAGKSSEQAAHIRLGA